MQTDAHVDAIVADAPPAPSASSTKKKMNYAHSEKLCEPSVYVFGLAFLYVVLFSYYFYYLYDGFFRASIPFHECSGGDSDVNFMMFRVTYKLFGGIGGAYWAMCTGLAVFSGARQKRVLWCGMVGLTFVAMIQNVVSNRDCEDKWIGYRSIYLDCAILVFMIIFGILDSKMNLLAAVKHTLMGESENTFTRMKFAMERDCDAEDTPKIMGAFLYGAWSVVKLFAFGMLMYLEAGGMNFVWRIDHKDINPYYVYLWRMALCHLWGISLQGLMHFMQGGVGYVVIRVVVVYFDASTLMGLLFVWIRRTQDIK